MPVRQPASIVPFCNHYGMHGHGKFGLTNLVNLDKLPPTGAVVIAAPLKIVGGVRQSFPCSGAYLESRPGLASHGFVRRNIL
jgi:kynurenine formamidase